MNKEILDQLEKIRNLATIPSVIQKLRATISNPNADAAQVSKIIENDPAMMTRILKIVNSAFYGGVEPVTSVQFAVARIGFTAISNIALSTFVFSSFEKSERRVFNREAFWKHCIATGIAAEIIYKSRSGQIKRRFNPDLLHLTGLLHDIGKIVFEQHFHEDFASAVKLAESSHRPLHECENETLGANHCDVGAWLGKKWNLDNHLIDVIQHHHSPSEASEDSRDLVYLCNAANYLCNAGHIGKSGDTAVSPLSDSVVQQLHIEPDDVPSFVETIHQESDKLDVMLSMT